MKYLKTLGILGGMGPEATSYLFNLIIKNTKVKKDQDHIPVVIFNYPQIPDRTLNIVENGESPLLYLIKGMKLLEKAKADVVIIPCNTAHYYIEEINKYSTLPILNMIELTSKHVKEMPVKKIGVMATTGTIRTKLYQRNLENLGLEVVLPTEKEQQELVMEAVYGKRGVKAGYKKEPKRLLKEISQRLSERGAEVIIAGCTEIPLVLSRKDIPVELVNPMEILAKAAVTYCKR
ncbi:MAG: aspartate racemase [Bacteroidetes bacterium GWE2_39_28]|nr:MAG: aspartate racemase [Bacteroidetes bacterium GWE2_39_28]OFY14827.1 MAG: aspartate racemase [Bacteroidetes bacterium GWF2_39_10]OFZ07030.1 MAG: aspartate racemase [Bacteroidetes bacterium RIFOXYB2_FULL_39_7]OFZ10738.1 MAG: aspartate racemase [Bacteroidetes bacterium RIFOXYC2_FULL_39_11]HCT93244.1 aspartate racemase [Rikenellaceae bacterium]